MIAAPARLPAQAVSPGEARAIAMDACIYAYAMMENYQTWYAQAVDRNSNAYVGGFNVYLAGAMLTPADRLAGLLPGARSGIISNDHLPPQRRHARTQAIDMNQERRSSQQASPAGSSATSTR